MSRNKPALSAQAPFEVKSTSVGALALVLKEPEITAIASSIHAKFSTVDTMNTPIMLDVRQLDQEDRQDLFLEQLLGILRNHSLQPIGIIGAEGSLLQSALQLGLFEELDVELSAPKNGPTAETIRSTIDANFQVVPSSALPTSQAELNALLTRERDMLTHELHNLYQRQLNEEVDRAIKSATSAMVLPPVIVDKPLRSGQRIYAERADLIILQPVSHGAEVIADGSIHVYAPLRGRAMAGATGNRNARIYASCMEPDLFSIAGVYMTTETPLHPSVQGKSAMVRLEGNRLTVDSLVP